MKIGRLLLYGLAGVAGIPFGGGTLCLAPPVLRARPVIDTVGTLGQCNGVLSMDFSAFATGALGGSPPAALQLTGQLVWCQYWGRDTVQAGPLLSNALSFRVNP